MMSWIGSLLYRHSGLVTYSLEIVQVPHRRDWNFLGGGGFCQTKNLKKCMKLNWNFQRGWGRGVLQKIPSVGEV